MKYIITESHFGQLKNHIQNLIDSELDNLREESMEWGLGEMDELNEINSVDDFVNELLNPDSNKFKSTAEITKILNQPENKAKFAAYTSNDILDNAYSLAARGSFISTNNQFIGKDGVKLATLIQNALNKGSIDQAEASFMAREIKDYLDMKQGKYNPITNEYARGALNLVNFLSTITSLPLAAISSTVEFAQIYRNLNRPQAANFFLNNNQQG